MKDDKDLSIEDILRETDEMLKSIDEKSAKANESGAKDIYSSDEKEEEVKTFVPSSKSAARGAAPADEKGEPPTKRVKTAGDKTRAVDINAKAVRQQRTVMRDDLKKQHYFEDNSRNGAYAPAPPQIIEKPATIKSKSRFNKTSDLQEIPTIVAVDELDRTRTIFSDEEWNEKQDKPDDTVGYSDSDQFKLNGFDDEMSEVPTIDEELAEEQLRRRREDKINKFRLFAKEEVQSDDGGEMLIIEGENGDYGDRTETLERLYKKKAAYQLQAAVTFIAEILLILLNAFKDSRYLPGFLGTDNGFFITVLGIYCAVLICNINTIGHGFNLRHGFNYDSLITVASLLTLGHTAAIMFNTDILLDGGSVYPCAAVFGLLFSCLGKKSIIMRVISNYDFLTDGKDKYTVEDIVNEVEAAIISRNLLAGEPLLKYSVRTEQPTSFFEISSSYEPADRISKVLVPVTLLLNIALFGVIGMLRQNWYEAFNLFIPGILISCPLAALCADNSALLGVSKKLFQKGAMVCGFEGAHYTHNSNAIVMEASELFCSRSCDLHGIRLFNKAKVDDALLLTAAVIMKTKSPLKYVFDDVIVGNKDILPEVDGVLYEDKMGTSAWIYQRKILVGNRDLLIHHGISVPKVEYENKYARKGRKALYLAVAGKIAAMFIVSYSADGELKRELKKLEKSGITILLKSCDPYINEESIMDIFDLPEGFVRVMTSSNARIFEKYSDMTVEKSPAYTVHNGTTLGFLSSIRSAENLVGTENMISVLVAFGSAIGFGVVALLGILDGLSQINAFNIIIFQAFWSIFILIATRIRISGL